MRPRHVIKGHVAGQKDRLFPILLQNIMTGQQDNGQIDVMAGKLWLHAAALKLDAVRMNDRQTQIIP
ncbi:hypothetical protein SAMN05444581_10355 [Methylocapsa palsarum]|uniref:Uncharacterized protein n=1 Tax=Methylocapsa palsarum TaxID=1612308 RepID=A0A1I3XEE0_9HYPH|nr:hypothetical protein SAMN05444581_10355 [Methylocapsa palsarum]